MNASRSFRIVEAVSAAARLEAAASFLRQFPAHQPITIVGATRGAADDLARRIAVERGATIGLARYSLTQLAARTAVVALAAEGKTASTGLGAEAVAARAVFAATRNGSLRYFTPVAGLPGFPRALARTLQELRLAGIGSDVVRAPLAGRADLADLLTRFDESFAEVAAADRADLLNTAARLLRQQPNRGAVLLLDIPVRDAAEASLVSALTHAAGAVLATVPRADRETAAALIEMGGATEWSDEPGTDDLASLRRFLFETDIQPPERVTDGSLEFFSAPGEGRECVEIARRVLREARRGVRFDEMAIFVRSPQSYFGLLEHALRRADVPAWFDRGTRRPHPAGRAFLALLACGAEHLSAARFAEYLSLGQVPQIDGERPEPWAASHDDALGPPPSLPGIDNIDAPDFAAAEPVNPDLAVVAGTVRAPWRWERQLVDAAVIGQDASRWKRRLDGRARELKLQIGEARRQEGTDSGKVRALELTLEQCDHLSGFAMPIINELAAWPAQATWGEWLDRFDRLAPRVLRMPAYVLRVLADLRPMADVGPVALDEARRVLSDRLLTLDSDPPARRFGRVFVGTPSHARGRAFRVVFLPGLAERMFPQKPREDPLLLDDRRSELSESLLTQGDRLVSERLLLQVATGAASERLYVSYPRIELTESRARVPSFYALDIMRAVTGSVPDHEWLEERARRAGNATLAWPAPPRPEDAIDDQEHDLAVLRVLLDEKDSAVVKGHAHYLLGLNECLKRSVVDRWARGQKRWSVNDGLIRVAPATAPALAAMRLTARSYSVSALQKFTACPYQFVLSALYRLEPLAQPEPLQRMDPLTRGSIFHDIQARFFRALLARGALPVNAANMDAARLVLEHTTDEVAAREHDELAPAVERVWADEVASIRRDLLAWLHYLARDGEEWQPARFEFAFGPVPGERDATSVRDEVMLDGGFRLRGAIDLIETHRKTNLIRVTDHKTGRKPERIETMIIGGGAVLQPVLYAMAVEKALDAPVSQGRLFYCTSAGSFYEHPIPLNEVTRSAGLEVLRVIDRAIEIGFLAASPGEGACDRCNFVPVCGREVPKRVERKPQDKLADLDELREAAMNAGLEWSDEDSRRLIRDSIDETIVVEAAAGTGKTTELVNRILCVLREGRAEVREIVAVTFTEKAAGELKLRLRQGLERERRAAVAPIVIARLEAAVQNLEEAHVSTIHGFCADLLRERPVEARVDPLFRVLTEGQSERLFRDAFDAWLQTHLEDPPEGVRRSLRRSSRTMRPGEADEEGPLERLRRAAFDLAQWRDFGAPWTREPFDRAAAITAVVDLVHGLADVSAKPSYTADNFFIDTEPVRRLSRDVKGTTADDLDALEARLIDLHRNRDFKRRRKGSGPTYSKGVTRSQVLEARDALTVALNDFQLRADADLSALLHGELRSCLDRYETLKGREGALDFLDLLLRARDLIRDDVAVRRDFQSRFKRIFVDEFQDTDPLQAELLILLASSDAGETRWEQVTPVPGKLFVVGDPKQSIYRFRRADVDVYRRACQRLEASGAMRLELRKSFRAVPNIQRVVNAAFAPVMDGDVESLQARYMPLEPARSDASQPSVVALPVPEPYGRYSVTAMEIEASLPDAVGAYVDWLVHRSGWTVTERRDPGRRVPLEPRHVCLLFRRFVSYGQDITRRYVEALEARGVRHLLVGGKTFHEREEIETIRAALTAIEWPDDQLSVFATLRGALFAIGDEELLEYHHLGGRFHPFRIPATLPEHLLPVREALAQLARLHTQRNRQPAADTITTLLDHTRAHVGFVLRPGGEQALANVLHVAELARQYEMEGGMSFRGFVETLQARSSATQAAEAPILEEGSDGVRLMTVHKAKGLEFPVVVLADMTARLTPWDAGRYVDSERGLCALRIGGWSPKDLNDNKTRELRREQREGERVAYVAATRARDLLVIPAVGDEPYAEGWVAPLNRAIYPAEDARRVQARAVACPLFKSKDTVLQRPDGDPANARTVCPGQHSFGSAADSYSVVWWSPEPAVLSLDAQAPLGLRRDDLIVKDVSPEALARYLRAYMSWRTSRQEAVSRAKQLSLEVVTATELALRGGPLPTDGIDVWVEDVSTGSIRPGGARFGALVHALLADVPLSGSDTHIIERLAAAHGRVLGADLSEIEAANEVVRRVLEHPLLQEAAQAAEQGRCYRETPVTLRLDPGVVIEGTVDLAYDTDGHVTVIDFKTDRELEGALDVYRRQVQIYAYAIAAATGLRARAVLMKM